MRHGEAGGNQIHGGRLDIHLLEKQSTTVEMYLIDKMAHFRTNIEEKYREKRKSRLSFNNQLFKIESFDSNWILEAIMAQNGTTKR